MTTPSNLFSPQACLREEFGYQIPINGIKPELNKPGGSLYGSTGSTGESNEAQLNSSTIFARNNYFDSPDNSCLNSPQWNPFDKDFVGIIHMENQVFLLT